MALLYKRKQTGNITIIGDGKIGGKGHNIHNTAIFLERHNDQKIPKTVILATDVIAEKG